MRIALGAVLVLALVWFVALRPKSQESAAPVTPAAQQAPAEGGTGLTDRPNQAESAVNDANAKNSADEQKAAQTGSDTPSTATPKSDTEAAPKTQSKSKVTPTPKSATTSTDPSAAIIASAQSGNVEVVLFYDPAGSDDQHVFKAVQQVDTRDGTVKVHAYKISEVGKYTALTQDVAVNVAPTLIILSPKLDAWRITGYTDTSEINALVGAIARRFD
jgi:hypothetical protein